MKKIERNPELQINQLGNRSDFFGKEISDLFSSNHEKLSQIIDLGLKEHLDDLPGWYNYIVQGVVYYFFTNKELLHDILHGESGYEWQRFQESFRSHYKYQPKQEEIKESLHIFAQRIIGRRAKSVFKPTAISKYDELFSANNTSNRDEEKMEELTLSITLNYIANELARTLAIDKQLTQLDISKSIVSRYKQDVRLHKLIKKQIELMNTSIFNQRPSIEEAVGGNIFLGNMVLEEPKSKKDYFSFFENYIDLTYFPSLLTNQDFYEEHPSFKKIISDYYEINVKFGFGLDEKKIAAGAVLLPKITKIVGNIQQKFDLKEKLFPIDETEFITYGDAGEKFHIQKTGKRVKSSKPDGYTQLVAKIIPHKHLIDIVASFQVNTKQYQFKSSTEQDHQTLLASNDGYEVTKFGCYPYYIGSDKKTGDQLLFVSLSNDLKEERPKGHFFVPIGTFGEFGYQPISMFNNDIDEFYRSFLQKFVDDYAKQKKFQLNKNEIEFIKNAMIIWFTKQPIISMKGKPIHEIIHEIQQIYETIFLQTEHSQIKDGKSINPVYEFHLGGKKLVPTQLEMFDCVKKDFLMDKKLTNKTVLNDVNIQHLFHFKLTTEQKNKLADYINQLVESNQEYANSNALGQIIIEFEKEMVIDAVKKLSHHRERIITCLWNIWVAQQHKDEQIEIDLIKVLKDSCKSLLGESQQDIAYISFLEYLIALPDGKWNLEQIKQETIKRTTIEKKTTWKTDDGKTQYGIETDSLFDEGAHFEILMTEHIFGTNKYHTHYSGGYTTLLNKDLYKPKYIKNNLELSPSLDVKPSELRHKDNDVPLPLCESPQIKSFIDHYLDFRHNNSSILTIDSLKKNENLLKQWLCYFIKKPGFLITYLGYLQEKKLLSNKDNLIIIWLSNIISDSPNPYNFDSFEDQGKYIIDDATAVQIFYHLGYINQGEGLLQQLGEKCSIDKDFDGLDLKIRNEINTIQSRITGFVNKGLIEKKLVSI